MAWSFTDLLAYEENRFALDKPLIAVQAIARALWLPPISGHSKWIRDADYPTTVAAATDRAEAEYPSVRAYDGYSGLTTRPDSSPSDDVWYYAIDAGGGQTITFDCAFILYHNFGTVGGLQPIEIEIADDAGFTTSLTTVGTIPAPSVGDDSRLATLDLSHGADGSRTHDTAADAGPNRYTSQYVRLKLEKTGFSWQPQIGELILGRRRQLEYVPDRPYDRYMMSEVAETTVSINGLVSKTVYSRRGFELAGDLRVENQFRQNDLIAFFRECTGPFVWIENPNTAPESYQLMIRDGGFSMPTVEANMRTHRLAAIEQGPESLYLDVEENG